MLGVKNKSSLTVFMGYPILTGLDQFKSLSKIDLKISKPPIVL